jgi:hypothetical protein
MKKASYWKPFAYLAQEFAQINITPWQMRAFSQLVATFVDYTL